MSSVPVQQVLKNHELRLRDLEKKDTSKEETSSSKTTIDELDKKIKYVEENYANILNNYSNSNSNDNEISKYNTLIEEQKEQIKQLTEELIRNNKLTYLIKQELEKQINYNNEINRLYNLFHSEFLEFKQSILTKEYDSKTNEKHINETEEKNKQNINLDISEKTTKENLKAAIESSFQ